MKNHHSLVEVSQLGDLFSKRHLPIGDYTQVRLLGSEASATFKEDGSHHLKPVLKYDVQ